MLRLLLVDDERTIAMAMEQYFLRLGFQVDVATLLEDALRLAHADAYAVAITDLRLDDASETGGLRVARALKERDSQTRVVLLTAYRSSLLEREAVDAGVDVIVGKPLPLSELARVVTGLCMKRVSP